MYRHWFYVFCVSIWIFAKFKYRESLFAALKENNNYQISTLAISALKIKWKVALKIISYNNVTSIRDLRI